MIENEKYKELTCLIRNKVGKDGKDMTERFQSIQNANRDNPVDNYCLSQKDCYLFVQSKPPSRSITTSGGGTE